MTKIIIEVEGGCLVNVLSSQKDTEVHLFDWDNYKEMDDDERKKFDALYSELTNEIKHNITV